MYVRKIDHRNNRIEIGNKEDLLERKLFAEDVNYVSSETLKKGSKVFAKIRYNDKGASAKIVESEENTFAIEFDEPKSAITPGQSAVLYDDNGYVLAGGVICRDS
ncbi:MAG: aminomethyltransferase beta-barrel domain-containing protein [Melioribacteraceae bacterium]|nr:aminomethyltransferase beta-barrel domain-containing protein [Melioribacteraceae bacterium]